MEKNLENNTEEIFLHDWRERGFTMDWKEAGKLYKKMLATGIIYQIEKLSELKAYQ